MIRTLMTTRMITAKEWNYFTTESIEGENNAVVAEVPFFLSSDKLRLGVQFSTPFLAVQDSSIGDLVTHSVSHSLRSLLI